jgi:hypothetical protein
VTLLAVDPGLRGTGWAVFERAALALCGCAAGGAGSLRERAARIADGVLRAVPMQIETLIIERPQVYAQRKQRGDPNDLVDMGILVGVLMQALDPDHARLVLPRDWKGTIPKAEKLGDYIVHKRSLRFLLPSERRRYEAALEQLPGDLRHNVADAVGIGLWMIVASGARGAQG